MKKILFLSLCIILLAATGCDSQFSNKALQKRLEADGDFAHLDFATIKTMEEEEIAKDVKVLLFSAKAVEEAEFQYHIAIARGKGTDPFTTAYEPLSFLQNEILTNRPQGMNTEYFKRAAERLAEDDEYFDHGDNAAVFLREITGADGIIATATARDAITAAAKNALYPDSADFWVVFEDGNANPLSYCVQAVESVYSWDWLPESQYLTFATASGKAELEAAEKKYGPAYTDKSLWVAYDIDGSEIGTYKTKNQLYEAVTGNQGDFAEEPGSAAEGTLKVAVKADNPPFAYITDGTLAGIDVDIANAISEELNMTLEISTMSAEAAAAGASKGTYHMASGAYTGDIQMEGILFSDNYYKDYVIVLGEEGGELNDRICAALAGMKSRGEIERIAGKHNASAGSTAPVSGTQHSAGISYRVRKSADDSQSQIGAFSKLDNAKKEANNHKAQGYKVFDMYGNLIYTP